MAKLTAPQKKLMLKAMRGDGTVPVAGPSYRVAANLAAAGYGQLVAGLFYANRAGLEALLYDRKMEDCRQGSMASMGYVREVEEALATGDFA